MVFIKYPLYYTRWSLENLINDDNMNISLNPDKNEDYIFMNIGKIVRKHNEAIE